jgi:hypothetical protein
LPGEEYETATPPPPEPSVDSPDVNAAVAAEPMAPEQPASGEPEILTPPAEEPPSIPPEEPETQLQPPQ